METSIPVLAGVTGIAVEDIGCVAHPHRSPYLCRLLWAGASRLRVDRGQGIVWRGVEAKIALSYQTWHATRDVKRPVRCC